MHALRDGEWKYIDNTPPEGLPENRLKRVAGFEPQLYDLSKDPGERTNLYKKNPEKAEKLAEKLNGIRKGGFTR
jgi:arylsulfatase A-like enzyme